LLRHFFEHAGGATQRRSTAAAASAGARTDGGAREEELGELSPGADGKGRADRNGVQRHRDSGRELVKVSLTTTEKVGRWMKQGAPWRRGRRVGEDGSRELGGHHGWAVEQREAPWLLAQLPARWQLLPWSREEEGHLLLRVGGIKGC